DSVDYIRRVHAVGEDEDFDTIMMERGYAKAVGFLDGEDAALLPAISSASEQQDKLMENTMQETLKELKCFLATEAAFKSDQLADTEKTQDQIMWLSSEGNNVIETWLVLLIPDIL
ncbi:hypothetical protein ACJX0J_018347, partial [Zea mays]